MARKRRSANKKKTIAVIYRKPAEPIRYVDMPAEQLPLEVKRLTEVLKEARMLLDRAYRIKHPIVEHVRFHVSAASLSSPPIPMTQEQMVQEIGRLNLVLNTAKDVLARFKTPVPVIQEALFRLQYGQTSRKREASWNSFRKDREDAAEPASEFEVPPDAFND